MLSASRSWFPYLALALLLGSVGWAVSFSTLPPADFTFCNGTEIASVDPSISSGEPEGRIIWALFEGLVRWDPKTLEPIPGVAERWELSDDLLTYTFHFREDARWSDNSPVTADDFHFSYQRLLHPATASKYAYQMWYVRNAQKYTSSNVEVGDIVEVELDDRPPKGAGRVLKGKLLQVERPPAETATSKPSPKKGKSKEKVATPTYVVEIEGKARRFCRDKVTGTEKCEWVLPDFDQVGIKSVNPRTLQITLASPTPFFIKLLGFYPTFPVNPRCVMKHGYPLWTKPENIVSNGAFRLASRRIRDRIRLVKSETYWNRANVQLNVIDALAVQSDSTMLNMYLTGQVDWIPAAPVTAIPKLLEQQRDDFYPSPQLSVAFYRINVTRPPLDNVLVRRALSLAIDRQEIVQRITRAGEVPATSLVPPGIPQYDCAAFPGFDLELARKTLTEAGYPGGQDFPKIEILYNKNETHEAIAQLIQARWKQILGIDVGLRQQEWGVYLDSQKRLDFMVARAGWSGDYIDPNTFLDMFVTGGENNQTGWGRADYDQLIQAASVEGNPQKRMEIFRRAETIFLDELPVIPIYYKVSKNMVRPYVKGFYPTLQDVHPLWSLSIDPEEKRQFKLREGLR
jgi:oligopeptide transport system substrate-binding protein